MRRILNPGASVQGSKTFIAMHPDTAERLRRQDELISTGAMMLVGSCHTCRFKATGQCVQVRSVMQKDEHQFGCTVYMEKSQ